MYKRLWTVLLLAAVMLLTGCQAQESAAGMYIEPAQLNDAEDAMLSLLHGQGETILCDYRLEAGVQSVRVETWELIDGEWKDTFGSTVSRLTGAEGRMAFQFDVLPDGMRTAVVSGEERSSTSQYTTEPMDVSGFARSTARISGRTAVTFDQPVPVAIQQMTSKNQLRSADVAYFHTPEQFEAHDADHIYALTVTFSRNPLE